MTDAARLFALLESATDGTFLESELLLVARNIQRDKALIAVLDVLERIVPQLEGASNRMKALQSVEAFQSLASAVVHEAATDRSRVDVEVYIDAIAGGRDFPQTVAEWVLTRHFNVPRDAPDMRELSAELAAAAVVAVQGMRDKLTAKRQATDAYVARLNSAYLATLRESGPDGSDRAARIEQREAESAKDGTAASPWRHWVAEADEPAPRFLIALLRALWPSVQDKQRRFAQAQPLSWGGDGALGWRTLPKATAPISWAFGGPGVKVAGDTYTTAPDVASALVPRSYPLLLDPGRMARPHQAVLALEPPAAEVLPVAVVGATNYAISPLAAKVALLALANESVKRGKMQSVELGELARLINPKARRIQARDLEATALALDELRRLFVYLLDGGKVPLFGTKSAANPSAAKADLRVLIGLTPEFLHSLLDGSGITGPAIKGGEYKGAFLVNLDGLMRIPSTRPALMRHAIRAYAHWNAAFKPGTAGEFDRSQLPTYTTTRWAALTNTLPPGVVEYLQTNSASHRSATRRKQLSKDKKSVIEDLSALEDMGLVRVDRSDDELQVLPPAAYLEAWRKLTSGEGTK